MNNLIRFLQKYYYVFLFLILEGIAIYFISCNSYYQGSAITNLANNVAGYTFDQCNKISHYFSLASVNEELVKENARLREQIESSYVKYTDRVMIKDDTIYKQQFAFMEAKVISKSINKRNNYFMLNKGRSSGIDKDMSVIAQNGIVGIVTQVTDNFSLVMTVLHQDSKIAVKNKRTQASGTLVWEGGSYEKGKIIDIPSSMPLKVGDTIITSGFSRNFPEGIIVGYIEKFSKDQGSGFYNVDIKYSTDYNKLGFVYVVKNFFKIEQEQLEKGMKNE
ncbi:MAG: rod shape-determining protein MreC [Bacteroidales bacterium]|jgi:rod shape-determining protein MreC|nr:rod shape-determining protein MreC [Bacteroidales bacterium]